MSLLAKVKKGRLYLTCDIFYCLKNFCLSTWTDVFDYIFQMMWVTFCTCFWFQILLYLALFKDLSICHILTYNTPREITQYGWAKFINFNRIWVDNIIASNNPSLYFPKNSKIITKSLHESIFSVNLQNVPFFLRAITLVIIFRL